MKLEQLEGFICGQVKVKKNRFYHTEGYIQNWFIEENLQSRGVGKALLDALTLEFKKAGCTHLDVDTHLENTKAIEIYEHLDFHKRLVTFFKIL